MKGAIVPVVAVLLAEAAYWGLGVQSDSIAPPSAAFSALWQALLDGTLLAWTGQTLGAALGGLGIGAGLGVMVAALIGLSPQAFRLLRLPIEFLRPIPAVALLPLALLAFGFGLRLEISIVAFATFWPMVIVGGAAIAAVDPQLLEVARMLRLSWTGRVWKIVLPAALPRLFVALRLAAGVAVIVAVTAEIALNPLGLGFAMMQAQQMLQPALMFGVLIWVGLVGWGINAVLLLGQRTLFGPAGTAR